MLVAKSFALSICEKLDGLSDSWLVAMASNSLACSFTHPFARVAAGELHPSAPGRGEMEEERGPPVPLRFRESSVDGRRALGACGPEEYPTGVLAPWPRTAAGGVARRSFPFALIDAGAKCEGRHDAFRLAALLPAASGLALLAARPLMPLVAEVDDAAGAVVALRLRCFASSAGAGRNLTPLIAGSRNSSLLVALLTGRRVVRRATAAMSPSPSLLPDVEATLRRPNRGAEVWECPATAGRGDSWGVISIEATLDSPGRQR